MANRRRLKLLFISMEYVQHEINEPIYVDILLQSISDKVVSKFEITVRYRDLGENLEDYSCFDVILVSTKISSYGKLCEILHKCQGKIVIVGGILAICAGEELARLFPEVIFCTGEGELNLNSILELLREDVSINDLKVAIIEKNIPNICFYNEKENRVFYSYRSIMTISNRKEIIPHGSAKCVNTMNGLIRMETSRGCPWNKCSFCVMPWKFCGEKWREYPKSKVYNEIMALCHNGVRRIFFTDEDFVGNYMHIMELCDILNMCQKQINEKIYFCGSTSVFTLINLGGMLDKCLSEMKAVGIDTLFIGVESGCDSQLSRYNKGVSSHENEMILKKLFEYEFILDVGFIMFDAETTIEELSENLDFINRCGLRNTVSRFAKRLRITPHTSLYKQYLKKGLIISDLDFNELYYEYRFCDPRIEIICSYIEKIDTFILEESYRLQAILRVAKTEAEKKETTKQLMKLRETEYLFLRECVEIYKLTGKLDTQSVLKVYEKSIIHGGASDEKVH